MSIEKSRFFEIISEHGLVHLIEEYRNDRIYEKINKKIKSGCFITSGRGYDKFDSYAMDISIDSIVGQIGRYSDCSGICCNGSYYIGSTWLSALRAPFFYELLEKFKRNPYYYLNEMDKKLGFYTYNNIDYYSNGCSRRAIIAKLFLSVYNDVFEENIILRNVNVWRPKNV